MNVQIRTAFAGLVTFIVNLECFTVRVLCIVEWSKCYDFAAVEGSFVLSDLTYKLDPHSNSMEYTIPDLESVSNTYPFVWTVCNCFFVG